ncbi:hypothetical protein MTBLM5_40117 [Magnetospirillum sp. LM-5]|uniref:hypothetical protein n=1 Tax=Magnetospirillum sp. LM-5 TaxID=2681466 RepID=UPI00137F9A5F|nr:hypothetical protein [Magnetospirillum sp. LM-5]CAA7621379.1 hypothetical protein MTBLM5_40117 [Magnetospirillum sp. LM-5]
MDRFTVSEARLLFFHRVLIEQAIATPGLIERALARLRPAGDEAWRDLLDGPFERLAEAVLEASPQGGLLRAQSPLMAALSDQERNALWQRVGLQQVVAYAQAACADLGLSPEEELAVMGEEASRWHQAPPQALTAQQLEPLKQIIAIQRALATLEPDHQRRRDWLRQPHPAFSVAPIDILVNGGGEFLQHGLAEMVRPHLSAGDVPAH